MSTKTSSQYTIIKKVQTIIGRKTNKQNTTRYTIPKRGRRDRQLNS
jgi:hypothetical protein